MAPERKAPPKVQPEWMFEALQKSWTRLGQTKRRLESMSPACRAGAAATARTKRATRAVKDWGGGFNGWREGRKAGTTHLHDDGVLAISASRWGTSVYIQGQGKGKGGVVMVGHVRCKWCA